MEEEVVKQVDEECLSNSNISLLRELQINHTQRDVLLLSPSYKNIRNDIHESVTVGASTLKQRSGKSMLFPPCGAYPFPKRPYGAKSCSRGE